MLRAFLPFLLSLHFIHTVSLFNPCWETLMEAAAFSLSCGEDEETGRGSPLLPPKPGGNQKKALLAKP